MNFRNTLLAAGVALTTCGAAALSLGESRGTVVLGRPLDLVFQVLTDGAESVDAACVAADILLGDTLISQSRIDITPLPAVAGRSSAVRLRASGVVNEPIVTVQLSAGCSGKITRTYTFLSDLPTTVPRYSSASPVNVSRLSSAAGVASAVVAGSTPSVSTSAETRLATRAKVPNPKEPPALPVRAPSLAKPSKGAPAQAVDHKAASASRKEKALSVAAPATARSRLVLEPLDIWL